ncbi:MAG: D-TA family PLP-dependent enzyme [Treponema sp.]|jgi:D-serine deaminase-like pyridoxal phosphate-dependent protein|nr:D-TA family PLP-dependent enzyme [Treponema sp.]
MKESDYTLADTGNLISPALIYYRDIILANTRRVIEMAGGADRLWPHVKSHKAREMIRLQIEQGITRFKCATVAEAEMTAAAGAAHVILAYPLIGPNISRYLRLAGAYPQTVFYAIGDDYDQLSAVSSAALRMGIRLKTLIDVDMGMHRTGVALNALESLYERASALEGLSLEGLHCYDGHLHDKDFFRRKKDVDEIDQRVLGIREAILKKGLNCGLLVFGGTPTFPCRAGQEGIFLSPGTAFIGDWGYYCSLPDIAFTPGAALFTRVVSHPAKNAFTLDLGYKGIASDPAGGRGIIVGMEDARPLFQSEEHWVFSKPEGRELLPIGSPCYVLPTHICPTSALYPEILVARQGRITETWQVSARNRRITY